ncbi:hypothetical protein YC2023_076462 [Brassica napus]
MSKSTLMIYLMYSTLLIQETTEYMMNKLPNGYNTITNDIQVTLTIWDYNQNATAGLDVDLIITDLEETNKPPTTEEENDICTICLENYNYGNKLCLLTCVGQKHVEGKRVQHVLLPLMWTSLEVSSVYVSDA